MGWLGPSTSIGSRWYGRVCHWPRSADPDPVSTTFSSAHCDTEISRGGSNTSAPTLYIENGASINCRPLIHTTGRRTLCNLDPEQLRQVHPDLLKRPRRQTSVVGFLNWGSRQHAMVDQANPAPTSRRSLRSRRSCPRRRSPRHRAPIRVAMHPTALARELRQPMRRIEVEASRYWSTEQLLLHRDARPHRALLGSSRNTRPTRVRATPATPPYSNRPSSPVRPSCSRTPNPQTRRARSRRRAGSASAGRAASRMAFRPCRSRPSPAASGPTMMPFQVS